MEQLGLGACLIHVALRHADSCPVAFPFETLTQMEMGGGARGIGMSSPVEGWPVSIAVDDNEVSPRASQ